MLGDSLTAGGAQYDQSEVYTSILQTELRAATKRPVIAGNSSAGSWGPPNMLAYVQKYGFFDADLVVILLSSHD